MTKQIVYLPHGGVVIPTPTAQDLAQTILQAQDLASRHGMRLKAEVLLLAAELASAAGNTEATPPLFDETIEHEQIDTQQAADILGCSPRNVRDLATKKRIPGIKKGQWRFNRDDILVYRDFR